ncbi:hypothetical protein A0J61_09479 [Choanephora cucurbitarum]|uniref:Uncharacterized protein n=1 Tax=Choanephora cucurbitarum TaxID=101091 RepID=A0A1C7N090_9FUNG|nr:hypothetical protein A0J61_09479 [Choanephora cucurbitarum]
MDQGCYRCTSCFDAFMSAEDVALHETKDPLCNTVRRRSTAFSIVDPNSTYTSPVGPSFARKPTLHAIPYHLLLILPQKKKSN